jgi:hypothetical protein
LVSGFLITIVLFFVLSHVEGGKSLSYARSGSKSPHVGLAMTTLARVQMSSLVSTMSTCRQNELNMFEGNAYSYFSQAKNLHLVQ